MYEMYFIQIRNIRKNATYGTLMSMKKQLLTFQNAVKDRINFLYQSALLKDNLEQFLTVWRKITNEQGRINLPTI